MEEVGSARYTKIAARILSMVDIQQGHSPPRQNQPRALSESCEAVGGWRRPGRNNHPPLLSVPQTPCTLSS